MSRAAQLYRETLKRCRDLGGERGQGARLDAQSFYAQFRTAKEPEAAEALLASAESRVSYLRMITPRFSGGRRMDSATTTVMRGSTGSFVVRDGVLQARSGSSHLFCFWARQC